ncbi:DUF3800 domain-containing protein [Arenimonas terrae]|uniref:DUF3800 domain-containing protein n=1 Tax=Arenimonas terrae TaxID=2546226 RepID=A0A5C4RNX7_9GAMM|nr:DUF3800 domain-containing protein [Arenimonas terrae]TNJ32655.1 hypothetical protein E1B00_14750 [Arenimonas terrae]
MSMQIWVDESGGKGVDRLYSVVGLIAQAESWAVFSDEWKECLSEGKQIKTFKMKTVAKWREPQRTEKLKKLVAILKRHVKQTVVTVLDIDLFVYLWGEAMPKGMDNHYLPPFYDTMTGAAIYAARNGETSPFEAIFDRQDVYAQHAIFAYPTYLKTVEREFPALYPLLPALPAFSTDDDFMPLQAADMYAWCIRNKIQNRDNTFDWILEELKPTTSSEFFSVWDINTIPERVRTTLQGVIDATSSEAV